MTTNQETPTTTPPPPPKQCLVVLKTQAGVQHQIWYNDKGKFVGCEGNKNIDGESVVKIPLPDRDTPWTIADALEYIKPKKEEGNGFSASFTD